MASSVKYIEIPRLSSWCVPPAGRDIGAPTLSPRMVSSPCCLVHWNHLVSKVSWRPLLDEPGVEFLLRVAGEGGVVERTPPLPVLAAQAPLAALRHSKSQLPAGNRKGLCYPLAKGSIRQDLSNLLANNRLSSLVPEGPFIFTPQWG